MKKSINAARPRGQNHIALFAIGCSAGGIEALARLLSRLPTDLKPAIAIVQHVKANPENDLAGHFRSLCPCPVKEIEDKEPIAGGTVYFAPPDYHVLVGEDHCFHLSVEEPVCFARPSIDVLLETAADVYGDELVAAILTGANEDGANGLKRVAVAGGRAIVQSAEEAQHSTMPLAALTAVPRAEILKLDDISDVLGGLS